ncbi:MAG: hypothetical protein HRT68_04065 [Flavobacteriaceae bacterium]|nr:hypothetical protein [Flavobacteriaceae bacterium]
MTNKQLKAIGIAIGVCYLLSATMECYLVDGQATIGSFGFVALLLGWMNFDLLTLIWLANPFFLAGLLFFFIGKNLKFSLVISFLASILAFSFLFVDEVLKNEAGGRGKIDSYLLGYWLWLSSHVLLFIITFIRLRKSKEIITE